jgi:hypothetical protein
MGFGGLSQSGIQDYASAWANAHRLQLDKLYKCPALCNPDSDMQRIARTHLCASNPPASCENRRSG